MSPLRLQELNQPNAVLFVIAVRVHVVRLQAHTDDKVFANRLPHRGQRVDKQAGATSETAPIGVIAAVTGRAEKLREQMMLMCMQFHPVCPAGPRPPGRPPATRDKVLEIPPP